MGPRSDELRGQLKRAECVIILGRLMVLRGCPLASLGLMGPGLIESVLVANRGEIAVRILRSARELGIRTLAVYSEADRDSPHVHLADHAVLIGPPPANRSYLDITTLLAAAREFEITAVHPGYGFLAERADFADAVHDAGMIFVGPTGDTIRAMGYKTAARRRMAAAGVPIVPGSTDAVSSPSEARTAAIEIGFPVIVKASAGGGGKGMRVAHAPEEVEDAVRSAQREAVAAFGDGEVYLERFLARPRHIEIQVMGDAHGNIVHLGERECSIQRRHQKLLEEAPSSVLTADLRKAMGAAAVEAARAADYVGAGTVEFLYEDGEFFFLEMNTRLQVEHPVTEMVTGIDLVDWQFRIASGEPLSFTQTDIVHRGHALECRITSESPFDGFLPSTGTIQVFSAPGGSGVRWDGGIQQGLEIGLFYDPLLGKLIVHAPDRTSAIRRMKRALDELIIHGVETSIAFHRRLMDHPDFVKGDLSIRFFEEHPELLAPIPLPADQLRAMSITAALLEHDHRGQPTARSVSPGGASFSAWRNGATP